MSSSSPPALGRPSLVLQLDIAGAFSYLPLITTGPGYSFEVQVTNHATWNGYFRRIMTPFDVCPGQLLHNCVIIGPDRSPVPASNDRTTRRRTALSMICPAYVIHRSWRGTPEQVQNDHFARTYPTVPRSPYSVSEEPWKVNTRNVRSRLVTTDQVTEGTRTHEWSEGL